MGGEAGKKWAQHYDSRPIDFQSKVGDIEYSEAVPLLRELEELCESIKSDAVVIQVGSSSGRELAYLAAKFDNISFVGFDIDESILEYARKSHPLRNIEFLIGEAKKVEYLLDKYCGKKKVLFSHGSLQYVQPEHVAEFFSGASKHSGTCLYICEPANDSKGAPDGLGKSLWRGNFSYTHDYKYYAEKVGMITEQCKIIRPYKNTIDNKNTVHYYYVSYTELAHTPQKS